jgi:hypothetical protein
VKGALFDVRFKLGRSSARRNKIFWFAESKSFPQLMSEQQEIDAHLENDGSNGEIPDFPDLKTQASAR